MYIFGYFVQVLPLFQKLFHWAEESGASIIFSVFVLLKTKIVTHIAASAYLSATTGANFCQILPVKAVSSVSCGLFRFNTDTVSEEKCCC